MSHDATNSDQETKEQEASPTNQANSKDVQGMKPSGEAHALSISAIIGATMGAIGLILLLQGLFGTSANYSLSDGINFNLWWGLVLIAFGIIMWGGNYLISHARKKS